MSDVPNALMYVINIMTRDGVHFALCSTHSDQITDIVQVLFSSM